MPNLDMAPTGDRLRERATELVPTLAEHAEDGERSRRTADAVVDALADAGMFRLFTPARFGGLQTDLRTLIDLTTTLGAGDGSSAWLVGIAATAGWVTAHAGDRAQQEVFGESPDTVVCGGGAGLVRGRVVDGGAVISGSLGYASGSPHATWAVLMAQIAGMDPGFCLVPMSDARIEPTWQTAGMCATGSNTVVVEEVFVPGHRMIPLRALLAGSDPDVDPLYRLPMNAIGALSLVGPLLGMGRRALAVVTEAATTKAVPHTVYQRQRDSVAVQLQVAEAALTLETSALHARSVADGLTALAEAGEPVPPLHHARTMAQTALVARGVLDAVGALANVHGSGALANANPLRRILLDVGVAARHAAFNPAVGNELFGKALLGVDEPVMAMG